MAVHHSHARGQPQAFGLPPTAPRAFSTGVNLHEQLASLPQPLLDRLAARGFEAAQLEAWARTIGVDRDKRNRLAGKVEAPYAGDVTPMPEPGTEAHVHATARGMAA